VATDSIIELDMANHFKCGLVWSAGGYLVGLYQWPLETARFLQIVKKDSNFNYEYLLKLTRLVTSADISDVTDFEAVSVVVAVSNIISHLFITHRFLHY